MYLVYNYYDYEIKKSITIKSTTYYHYYYYYNYYYYYLPKPTNYKTPTSVGVQQEVKKGSYREDYN